MNLLRLISRSISGHTNNRPYNVVFPREEEQIKTTWCSETKAGLQCRAQCTGGRTRVQTPDQGAIVIRNRDPENREILLVRSMVSASGSSSSSAQCSTWFTSQKRDASSMDRIFKDPSRTSVKLYCLQ